MWKLRLNNKSNIGKTSLREKRMIERLKQVLSVCLMLNLICPQYSFAEKKIIHVKVKRSEIMERGLQTIKKEKKENYQKESKKAELPPPPPPEASVKSKLNFLGAVYKPFEEGQCVDISVAHEDAQGKSAPAPEDILVELSGAGEDGAFYGILDMSCSGKTLTEIKIGKDTNSNGFKYKKASAGKVTLSAKAKNLKGVLEISKDVDVKAASVKSKLNFLGAVYKPFEEGQCVDISVAHEDAQGKSAPAPEDILVELSGAGEDGAFYGILDMSCSGKTLTEIKIGKDTNSNGFKYKKASAGKVTLSAKAKNLKGVLGISKDAQVTAKPVSFGISGNIILESGNEKLPVPKAQVAYEGPENGSTTSDDKGFYSITVSKKGKYSIYVKDSQIGSSDKKSIAIDNNKDVQLDLIMPDEEIEIEVKYDKK